MEKTSEEILVAATRKKITDETLDTALDFIRPTLIFYKNVMKTFIEVLNNKTALELEQFAGITKERSQKIIELTNVCVEKLNKQEEE